MHRRTLIVIGSVFIAGGGALAGCGDDAPPTSGPTSTSSTSAGGGSGGEGGADGGMGDEGGMDVVGGMGGMGGEGGEGGAAPDEMCFNGEDDDENGLVDCLDDDPGCAAICGDACAQPMVLPDPGSFNGDTTSHAVLSGTSCAATPGAGPTHVFSVTAAQAGVLEAFVATADDADNFTVSIRTSCDDAGTELACGERVVAHEPPAQERVSTPAMAGETFYVVVQGFSFLDYGDYLLTVRTRVPDCPDGVVDPTEECDDGDAIDDNGCNNSCQFQPTETEPNDLPAEADAFTSAWYGAISPVGDRDMVTIDVPTDDYGIVAHVFDLGNGGCAMAELDSYLQLYDAGVTELAFDDNSGDGFCSTLRGRGLRAGQHFLRVSASVTGIPQHEFQYALVWAGDRCGNMTVAGPEECDDGNTASGDGCSATCTIE